MDYGRLPVTGAGLALGSVFIGQTELVAIALALVAVGTLLIRFGWRRGKSMTDA
jgi:hypothetical protein